MSAIRNKKSFGIGLALCISFLVVLVVIVSPVFNGKTGLQVADGLFNSISKGSTYFIPHIMEKSGQFAGKTIDATIKFDNSADAEKAGKLFEQAGADAEIKGDALHVSGDLSVIVKSALKDADVMFSNRGEQLHEKYGYDAKEVVYNWWLSFKEINKQMLKNKAFKEADLAKTVMTKALEPAYNFYGIGHVKVSERAGLVTFLLVFYVVYTVWWGYAIYFLFEGLGIAMSKPKEKKEF